MSRGYAERRCRPTPIPHRQPATGSAWRWPPPRITILRVSQPSRAQHSIPGVPAPTKRTHPTRPSELANEAQIRAALLRSVAESSRQPPAMVRCRPSDEGQVPGTPTRVCTGITPAHAGSASPPRHRGGPAADLRRYLVERKGEHVDGLQLLDGGRRLPPAPGDQTFSERLYRRHALGEVLDQTRAAKHDDRAVVDGVVHGRAGEHQPIEQCHRQADWRTGAESADRGGWRRSRGSTPPRRRARAWGSRRAAPRVPQPRPCHHRLIEDRVDRLAVVAPAGGLAD